MMRLKDLIEQARGLDWNLKIERKHFAFLSTDLVVPKHVMQVTA